MDWPLSSNVRAWLREDRFPRAGGSLLLKGAAVSSAIRCAREQTGTKAGRYVKALRPISVELCHSQGPDQLPFGGLHPER